MGNRATKHKFIIFNHYKMLIYLFQFKNYQLLNKNTSFISFFLLKQIDYVVIFLKKILKLNYLVKILNLTFKKFKLICVVIF